MPIAPRSRCRFGAALGLAIAACGRSTHDYAVTERGRPFSELNKAKAGTAPPAAKGVTPERLANARGEPHNWLTYYGSYDGQRFSSLNQINTSTVKDLRVAWMFQSGVIGLVATPATYAFEATPVVVDGVMFLTGYDG